MEIPNNNTMYRYKLSHEDLVVLKLALDSASYKGVKNLEETRKRLLKKMSRRDYFMILYFEPSKKKVQKIEVGKKSSTIASPSQKGE